jgi:hypothetical protein
MAKAKEKNANTVYRVPKEKGIIDFVSPEEAVKDIVAYEVYDAEAAGNQLEAGEVVGSETFFYAKSADALKEYEQLPEGEQAEPKVEPQEGDHVIDENGRTGVVFIDGATAQVKVMLDGKNKSLKLTDKWAVYTPDPEALALAAAEAEAALVAPMTDEERTRLEELENQVLTAKEKLEQAIFSFPMQMGQALSEISERQLYREFFGSFEEYCSERFGIARQYGYRLISNYKYGSIAQDTLTEVQETLQLSDGLQLSVRATEELSKGASRIAEDMGLGKAEFNLMRPVIDNAIRTLVDTAPKDKEGRLSLTPAVISKFNEVLEDVVKSNTVEVDGQAMTLEEAKEKGILAVAFQEQVITSVAEGIKANRDLIIKNSQEAYARQTAPVKGAGAADDLPVYKGKVIPEFSGLCSKHEQQDIIAIGNGTIQTSCQCRFRIDAESGKLVCFETDGKRVVVEKTAPPTKAKAKTK